MQYKTLTTLAIASLAIASPMACQDGSCQEGGVIQGGQGGGSQQGGSSTTIVEEEQGQSKLNNPLGPVGAIAAAIWGCAMSILGTA
ncbi:hypothetical protein DIURU_005412 [Diutina rugosa]|uniref:Uncharacterized protein n=1 Tax=Diutina rugosa TaxID=5481 RepID=A0A642UDK9_DIURU|nr:uncharacterized protein DIURU_005412 [Diutina rugosa]KAA8897179.1 hypothetical protein DIURU_005412 [Diutina rugosa]